MLKTIFPFVLGILLTLPLLAQSKLQFGITLFPNTSWLHSSPGENDQIRVGLTSEMGVSYFLGDHFSIGLGAAYAHFSAQNEDQTTELRWGSQHNGNGGLDPDAPSTYLYASTTLEIIELPFQVRYQSKEWGHWKWYASTGLSFAAHLLRRTTGQVKNVDGDTLQQTMSKREKSGFNNPSWSILLAGGLERQVGKRFTLFGGPRLQWRQVYNGAPLLTNDQVDNNYMQLGLEMGVRFR